MRQLHNEKGIALVTALMFTMLALGIIMTLLYMITKGAKISGANKSYKTALDATYGATELITKDVLPSIFKNYTGGAEISSYVDGFGLLNPEVPVPDCFSQKTRKNTALWDAGLCTADSKSEFPKQLPDMTFTLKATDGATGFKVYTKIVDTRCGGDPALLQKCTNSSAGGQEGLFDGAGTSASTASQVIATERKPAYYRIEIQGERASNPREKAELSVLYAY